MKDTRNNHFHLQVYIKYRRCSSTYDSLTYDFSTLWCTKAIHISRNHTWNFEFWSFPGLAYVVQYSLRMTESGSQTHHQEGKQPITHSVLCTVLPALFGYYINLMGCENTKQMPIYVSYFWWEEEGSDSWDETQHKYCGLMYVFWTHLR